MGKGENNANTPEESQKFAVNRLSSVLRVETICVQSPDTRFLTADTSHQPEYTPRTTQFLSCPLNPLPASELLKLSGLQAQGLEASNWLPRLCSQPEHSKLPYGFTNTGDSRD